MQVAEEKSCTGGTPAPGTAQSVQSAAEHKQKSAVQKQTYLLPTAFDRIHLEDSNNHLHTHTAHAVDQRSCSGLIPCNLTVKHVLWPEKEDRFELMQKEAS